MLPGHAQLLGAGGEEVQNSLQVAVCRSPGWSGTLCTEQRQPLGDDGMQWGVIHSFTHTFIHKDRDSAYDLRGAELGTGDAVVSQRPRDSGLPWNGDD